MKAQPSSFWTHYFPVIAWLRTYSRADWRGDSLAGVITAIMLIPQGIAYAMLAGLPPQMGLYASMLPAIVYAIWGSSRTMSVGPVSIAAIMIMSALSAPEIQAFNAPVESAILLAFEVGIILWVMAALRLGGLVNFISHPVLTGFTSGAALLIILNQLPYLFGLPKFDCGLQIGCYTNYLSQWNNITTILGLGAIVGLWLFSQPLMTLLQRRGMPLQWALGISKCGPLLVIALTMLLVGLGQLAGTHAVSVVGPLEGVLPQLSIDFLNTHAWRALLPYAAIIALIAYVESVAIAKVTAYMRNQKINPNQELVALGAANIATAVSGGMVVAGGLSRTMVNFTAGARTQMATVIAVIAVIVLVLFFGHWFAYIPKSVLAAIILVAILPLIKLRHVFHTWVYHKADGWAELVTLLSVLCLGIEEGLAIGIILTIASYLRQISRPHIAEVGCVPGTEHYRNIDRHEVETCPNILLLRIDENITFANANYIEDFIQTAHQRRQQTVQDLVLIFTSVSHIDSTALEMLSRLQHHLKATGVQLHFAEIKGPVMDKLRGTALLDGKEAGSVFFRVSDVAEALN